LSSNFDADVTATAICAAFRLFTDAIVREVRVNVVTAGTSHATHALDIYKGTSSIDTILIGTETSGVIIDATLTDNTFSSTDSLYLKTTDSDATFIGVVQVDYNEVFNNSN
jgi:hypothetical protein